MRNPDQQRGSLANALKPPTQPRFMGLSDATVNVGNDVVYDPASNIFSTETMGGVGNVLGKNRYGTGSAFVPNTKLGQTKNAAQKWGERATMIAKGQQPAHDPVAQQQNFQAGNNAPPQQQGGDNVSGAESSVRAMRRRLLSAELHDRYTSSERKQEILGELRFSGKAPVVNTSIGDHHAPSQIADADQWGIGTFEDRFSGGGSTAEDRKKALDSSLPGGDSYHAKVMSLIYPAQSPPQQQAEVPAQETTPTADAATVPDATES